MNIFNSDIVQTMLIPLLGNMNFRVQAFKCLTEIVSINADSFGVEGGQIKDKLALIFLEVVQKLSSLITVDYSLAMEREKIVKLNPQNVTPFDLLCMVRM